ncbi:DMT family transporter [Yinghuangia sp. YIM S09857]|uniref:DMT family transporter n=1 Tax=Yinghuangia sp. YIM S09857 TaxID=3436929 RepID=UPI003F539624
MPYVFLSFAIVVEVVATSLLKSTEGFSRPLPSVVCLACYGASFYLLSKALQHGLHVGVGYAIWSGVGTALIVVIGVLFLHQAVNLPTLLGIAMIVGGVVVLNMAGAH